MEGEPSRSSSGDGPFVDTSGMNVNAPVSSDIYDASRRSLRQLGLKPMEKGLPLLQPYQTRSSGKSSSKVEEEGR